MVPSRVFVGMVVFGLIATLVTGVLAVLVLSGYAPDPGAPYEVLFPEDGGRSIADKAVLVLAALFSIAFTLVAIRLLLDAARRDSRRRRGGRGPDRPGPPGHPPPGYG